MCFSSPKCLPLILPCRYIICHIHSVFSQKLIIEFKNDPSDIIYTKVPELAIFQCFLTPSSCIIIYISTFLALSHVLLPTEYFETTYELVFGKYPVVLLLSYKLTLPQTFLVTNIPNQAPNSKKYHIKSQDLQS